MVIKLKNQLLTKDQLKNGKINKNILSDTELSTIDLAKLWLNGQATFAIKTSGSTGKPQTINLSREILEYSARTSMRTLDPNGHFSSSLLCINPGYIGGMMVVIRAIIHNLDLTQREPGANPSLWPDEKFDLVSLVPLQLQNLLDHYPESITRFNTILIGGAPLPGRYRTLISTYKKTTCYQTYGMTETASHIALKNLTKNDQSFHTLGDIQMNVDVRKCLKVKGTVTGNEWIQTNDVVEIVGEKEFLWKGRADFVINTGGIKVHPEDLEARLSDQINATYFITGMPDERFGERVVLLIEGKQGEYQVNFHHLPKYEKPKEVIYLPRFVYTGSGKIDRNKTIEQLK